MLLTEARNALRLDLKDTDPDAQILEDSDLDRAVGRAVSDLTRFLPRDLIYEVAVVFTITDENWTSAAAAGTWVTLANKPIKFNSETVKNAAGSPCERDTDYSIDYSNGKITHISGGLIGDNESCTISYDKSHIGVDLSSIIDSLVRAERVEYPVGQVPQLFVDFELAGDFLTLTGSTESQEELTEYEHVAVHYKAKHSAPTPSDEGTYPSFLDGTVLLAAGAYALFALALYHEHLASADLVASRTALTSAATSLAAATTALAKVDTYLAGGSESTKALLAQITTDAAELRTAIGTALGAVATYLTGDTAPSAKKYLDDGDALINESNKGQDVAENFSSFALACVSMANGLMTEASIRLDSLRTYIEQASGYTTIANGFMAEAEHRIAAAANYISEAVTRQSSATQELGLSDKYRTDATDRRSEAWAIWKDPSQYLGDYVASSLRQPKR